MRNIIFILLSFLLPIIGYSQATSVSLGTSNISTLTLSYNTWTKVDPNITITANGNITGFRVQISQSFSSGSSGDQLRSTVTLPSGVTVSAFNQTTGILAFNGSASAADWQNVLRGVEFRSTTSSCYTLQRRVTFVAGIVFYNPLTQHFYEYVSGNTSWTNSKTSASNRSYFGRAGYLATMSSEAENNFVWKLMSSDAWFGASDEVGEVNAAKGTTAYASQAAVEQKWHWVTGPEKGTQFSNGSTAVTGQYAKWAGGEPNNSGGEHYGQFYSSNSGQWNDLPNTTLPGYICEYGDMPGDITTSTTILTKNIEISGASSGYISGGDINVCSGSNSTTLTLNNMTGSVVRWEYSFDNFFTAGVSIANTTTSLTLTNVTKTTYYRAIVNSTSPTSCTNLATSSVFLSVKPTNAGTIFAANNSICSGGLVELTLSGQQGNVNKWQRSSDNVNWENITNTTTSLNQTVYGLGNGLNTDGSNDYVLLPKPTLNNFTIEYWVKTTQTSLTGSQWYNGNGIVDAEVGGGTTDFGTSLLNNKLAFGVGNPDRTIQSTTSINNGQWYHVAVTWNGTSGDMKLYINGVLEASYSGGPTGTRSAPPNIRIGSIQTGIQYFAGSIDELRIWNTVRTQSEIETNMNNEVSINSALVSYYKFNQGTSNSTNTGTTTLSDASGNSNNGTLYNFALSGSVSNWTEGKGSTYYYRGEVQTPNCGGAVYSDSKMITVTSGTPPVGGSVSSVNLSSTTNSGSVTLSGYTGTIVKWQRSTNDGVTWTDLTNTTTTQSYTNITTKTLFRAQLQSGTCGFAYSSNGIVQIVNTISGTISLPSGNPTISLSLFRIVNNVDTLVETKNVNQNGTYSFNIPINNTTYKLVPSLVLNEEWITSTDFDLVWGEAQNINTPNNTAAGLIMTGTKQWKAADVNENGVLDLGDSYLVAAHISGMIPVIKVLWFNSTDYDLINKTNFSTINAVTSFIINVTTINVTQNIKYCMLGDINLSHSSN